MTIAKPLQAVFSILLSTTLVAVATADPIPAGARSANIEAVGYVDAPNASPFKMSLLESGDRWYMYTSNLFHRGWTIFDVTDPADPKMVKFIDGPENTSTWQLDIADGLMITSFDALSAGWGGDPDQPRAPEAVLIWSLEDPVNPKRIGSFTTGGGTHRNAYFGGDYMHLAANLPGYNGEVYMIVDISDPATPVEAGRFATAGMKEGDAEPYDLGRLHGPADVRGDLAFLPMGVPVLSSPTLKIRRTSRRLAASISGRCSADTSIRTHDDALPRAKSRHRQRRGDCRELRRGTELRWACRHLGPGRAAAHLPFSDAAAT